MSADTPGVDPFARTQRTSERMVTLSARAALVASVLYVGWRAGFTLSGADQPAAALLLAAEVLAVVVFAARVRSARTAPIEVVATKPPWLCSIEVTLRLRAVRLHMTCPDDRRTPASCAPAETQTIPFGLGGEQ